ncbi:hypothetical protein WJX74_009314 [Apatococcus lobatus]|uniref:Uncharacterized protein n=2 Tax=Apatococcus TaxID=904362 RepID=A0AAW1T6T6_9CHLO
MDAGFSKNPSSSEQAHAQAVTEQSQPDQLAAEEQQRTDSDRPQSAKPRLTKRQRRWARCEAGAWILAAAAVIFWGDGNSNAFRIIASDDRVRRNWMLAGFALLSIDLLSFLYLAIRSWWRGGRTLDPGKTPAALPIGTFSGLAAGASFWVAFWHIFRWITPLLLAVLFMGGVMLPHVFPSRESLALL